MRKVLPFILLVLALASACSSGEVLRPLLHGKIIPPIQRVEPGQYFMLVNFEDSLFGIKMEPGTKGEIDFRVGEEDAPFELVDFKGQFILVSNSSVSCRDKASGREAWRWKVPNRLVFFQEDGDFLSMYGEGWWGRLDLNTGQPLWEREFEPGKRHFGFAGGFIGRLDLIGNLILVDSSGNSHQGLENRRFQYLNGSSSELLILADKYNRNLLAYNPLIDSIYWEKEMMEEWGGYFEGETNFYSMLPDTGKYTLGDLRTGEPLSHYALPGTSAPYFHVRNKQFLAYRKGDSLLVAGELEDDGPFLRYLYAEVPMNGTLNWEGDQVYWFNRFRIWEMDVSLE